MNRQVIYDALHDDAGVEAIFGDRIMPSQSMNVAPKTKPFLVYRFGNSSRDNAVWAARRQYLTVFVHDAADPGDYDTIDQAIPLVIQALEAIPSSAASGIVKVEWLETSADFDDKEMGTILRYLRFTIALASITD